MYPSSGPTILRWVRVHTLASYHALEELPCLDCLSQVSQASLCKPALLAPVICDTWRACRSPGFQIRPGGVQVSARDLRERPVAVSLLRPILCVSGTGLRS